MKTRSAVLALAVVLGALAGAGGCTVDNRASIQVQAICLPPTSCEFAATCDAQYIGFPKFDLTTSTSGVLWLTLQVANELPDNADPTVGKVNTNDAHIDEIAVTVEGALVDAQSTGVNYHLPASGTAVISAKVGLSAASAGEVVAMIRLRGYYDDNTRFETGDFPVTVVVCSGCVPVVCGAAGTCPPLSEGQTPLSCIQSG